MGNEREILIEFKETRTTQIIVTNKGERLTTPSFLTHLWFGWCTHPKAIERKEGEFTVFSFTGIVDFDDFVLQCDKERYELS